MRIPRIYHPELSEGSEIISLPEQAHRHIVQVLRLKQGASIRVFDGQGLEYEAVLATVAKRNSTISLGNKIVVNSESPLNITLLQGISRGDRMDYAVQKAVELGVNHIVPVLTEYGKVSLADSRAAKRLAHWQGVMISACEQSGRAVIPTLNIIMPLQQAINHCQANTKLVFDPRAKLGSQAIAKMAEVAILIGPEGGLSQQEIQQAAALGFQALTMGKRILRTETAAVAALAMVQTLWGDLG